MKERFLNWIGYGKGKNPEPKKRSTDPGLAERVEGYQRQTAKTIAEEGVGVGDAQSFEFLRSLIDDETYDVEIPFKRKDPVVVDEPGEWFLEAYAPGQFVVVRTKPEENGDCLEKHMKWRTFLELNGLWPKKESK